MNADIEQLILSGKFFSSSRPSSPARTPSPDAGWHDEELSTSDDDTNGRLYQHQQSRDQEQHESVGMGPGRTGVKGVIRDQHEAQNTARDKRALEVAQLNKRMEKASLGGKTYLEEEREREIEKMMMEGPSDRSEKMDTLGRPKDGRFGHLREVGMHGFVDAVEREERNVWVVIHLYEPSVDRCYVLDETLAKLARAYPDVKFLRSRAAALGFASTPAASTRSAPARSSLGLMASRIDEDDEDDLDEVSAQPAYDEDTVDTDMLPTMLVYHDGDLVYNWVRVDWEAGDVGIEELLVKHRILPRGFTIDGNNGLSDDEDDLF